MNYKFATMIIICLAFSGQLHAQIPKPDHIVIVMMENHDYSQIVNALSAPYINSLLSDSNAAVFSQSFALTHPSQPNYIMLFSGANQGVINDNLPTTFPFTAPNLGAALITKGYTFTGYSEDLPSIGSNITSSGTYARKHNPWVNWQGTGQNGIPSSSNQPLTAFPTNFATLPTVSFVIPNMANDMHNGTDPTRISTADTWLKAKLDPYIKWSCTHNSLFILTFDENDNSPNNHILTIFIGGMVKKGTYTQTVNHYDLLRTIEDAYGTTLSGSAATATPINNCWKLTTDVHDGNNFARVHGFDLSQNYPNPFNPSTIIVYSIPENRFVSLKVYNEVGKEVATLVNEIKPAGSYEIPFNGVNLTSGIYFYQLKTGNYIATKKLVYLK